MLIDITLLILALFALWKGWQKGFIISIFTSLAWILGIIGALKLSSVAAILMRDKLGWHSHYAPIISFILIFIVIAFMVYLIGKSLEKVIQVIQLGFINRILGAVLRLFIILFIFSMFIWLINQAGMISPETKAQSKTYDALLSFSDHAIIFFGNYIPAVKNIFNDIEHFFESIADKASQTM
ncbi:MAG TPA: CvpA family protein [Chitinophagales bacterium]|nr:CvpA family protein [Chitinophagales bacterium]